MRGRPVPQLATGLRQGSGSSGHDIECRLLAGKRLLTGQQLSDFGLLSHLERVIYLDAKISNCALELRMA